MARKVHFSRLLDFISGSALAGATTKVQKSALYKDFDLARLESKKLRDLIDSNLPTFYVVDIDTITEEVAKGIGLNTFTENEDYVKLKYPKKSELVTFIKKSLLDSIKKLPEKSFLDQYKFLESEYQKLLTTLAQRSSYIGYRNASARFQATLRTKQKSTGVYIATDGKSVVSNLKSNSFLIVGPTFNSAVEAVNKLLNAGLREAFSVTYDITLKPYSADPKNRFTIGDFVNAGHTAAYTQEGKLIGVNAPFAQEKQFLLSGTAIGEGIDAAIAPIYLDAGYELRFSQQYSSVGETLLNAQFSFVITMPAKFNTATLRTEELRRIREYIGSTVVPTIEEQARKKFAGGISNELLLNSSASPTLYEYINTSIVNALTGKKTAPIKKTSNVSKSGKVPSQAIYSKKSKVTLKSKSGGTNIKSIQLPEISRINLVDLLSQINAALVQQIKQNMGSGSRRDVLNLRTGRFAESAKVERLSESRAGMITAFYSYMKNPYATFSEGGRQSSPRSRDPKLLIAKSIREIAAQQVGNRLRSVSI